MTEDSSTAGRRIEADITRAVKSLNDLIGEAANLGIELEIDVIDTTIFSDNVQRSHLNIRIKKVIG